MKKFIAGRGLLMVILSVSLSGCGGGGGGSEGSSSSIPATQAAYIIVAWNDLGMHCLNPTYDTAVILPPYNTVWAQVIQRGRPPRIVTSGITVEYRIENNTSSVNKTTATSIYGQFWTYVQQLFGATLAPDTGLNLDDPTVHNGLTGTMLPKGDHFQVSGIPVTPVNDSGTWDPFQVAVITVKDLAGNVLATTRATVPTSDEINCGKCHGSPSPATDPTVIFNDILQKHDSRESTTLSSSKPVLCASCHGSPALGQGGRGSSGKYLSEAIHSFHANRNNIQCYDCHPGTNTQCNRSARHTGTNGDCIKCHGDMSTVGGSITAGRTPWLSEPKCATCHVGVWDVDTGTVLYRNKPGHGGVYCAGCHGSPHAMVPSNHASDNAQALQYQGAAKTLGDCGICHATSRGGGSNFAEEHVAEGKTSACNVCHTGFINASNFSNWPHRFEWKAR